MKSSDLKRFGPLLVLIGYVLYREFTSSGDGSDNPFGINTDVLGTRTMSVIQDFSDKLSPIAKKVENETGISSRLGLVQAALESSYGSSKLSRPDAQLTILPANVTGPALNIFGLKCGSAWLNAKKPYVMLPTKDYYAKGQKMPNGAIATVDNQALVWPAPFRAYGSWEESYRDWARLMQIPVYVQDGALAALQADDLEKFGQALGIHYAPNQNYAKRISDRAGEMGLA
ncbi:MAG TPA: glucosaminidase domain-containing protein [Elusimicrobiota bacterium]|nr:glucosaminidase domain-containing protein [Elusimicrobiota bacterium]